MDGWEDNSRARVISEPGEGKEKQLKKWGSGAGKRGDFSWANQSNVKRKTTLC